MCVLWDNVGCFVHNLFLAMFWTNLDKVLLTRECTLNWCKSECSNVGLLNWVYNSYIPQMEQHEPKGQMLFHLGNVTYLLDVAPSNPLPHPLSPPPIPLQDHKIWLLSNIQQKHMPTTCSHHSIITQYAGVQYGLIPRLSLPTIRERGNEVTSTCICICRVVVCWAPQQTFPKVQFRGLE